MKPFPRRQGGWVIGALAAASALTEGIMGAKGKRASKDAAKSQREALRFESIDGARSAAKEFQATLGSQRAGYAAAGVDVNVGSVAQVLKETKDEYVKTTAANAYLNQQKLKGARAEAKTAQYQAVGGFFSSVAQFGASAANAYQKKGSFWE